MKNKFQELLDLRGLSNLKENNKEEYDFLFKSYLSKDDDQFLFILNSFKDVKKSYPNVFDLFLQKINCELITKNKEFKNLVYEKNAIKLSKRIFIQNGELNFNMFLDYLHLKYQVNSSDFYESSCMESTIIKSILLDIGYLEEEISESYLIAPIDGGLLEKTRYLLSVFSHEFIPFVNYRTYFSTVSATERLIVIEKKLFSMDHDFILPTFHEIFFKELEMFGIIKKYDSTIEMWI